MSRIGKLPIIVPTNIDINYTDSNIRVKGEFGILTLDFPTVIKIRKKDNKLIIDLKQKTKKSKALHGLYRTLINNMIIGVSKQFDITLILKGVGYRALIQETTIILNLGYSHQVKIKIPEQISVEIVKNTVINLKSCDKELLGLFASKIRAWRQPEPYKGKGILYQNEQIIRKAGKSAK